MPSDITAREDSGAKFVSSRQVVARGTMHRKKRLETQVFEACGDYGHPHASSRQPAVLPDGMRQSRGQSTQTHGVYVTSGPS